MISDQYHDFYWKLFAGIRMNQKCHPGLFTEIRTTLSQFPESNSLELFGRELIPKIVPKMITPKLNFRLGQSYWSFAFINLISSVETSAEIQEPKKKKRSSISNRGKRHQNYCFHMRPKHSLALKKFRGWSFQRQNDNGDNGWFRVFWATVPSSPGPWYSSYLDAVSASVQAIQPRVFGSQRRIVELWPFFDTSCLRGFVGGWVSIFLGWYFRQRSSGGQGGWPMQLFGSMLCETIHQKVQVNEMWLLEQMEGLM